MILAFETSCDETGISLIDGSYTFDSNNSALISSLTEVSSILNSQAKLHSEFGGVYPTLAKREHTLNILPLLSELLTQSNLISPHTNSNKRSALYNLPIEKKIEIATTWLLKESSLLNGLVSLQSIIDSSKLSAIAVTIGPGLEPALWVGVNVARTLALFLDLPLICVNHMEGHVLSAIPYDSTIKFPILSLLVSGGHTEIVYSNKPGIYEVLGSTRDDAAGEAFDKGARLLGLPYPGGKELSELAEQHRSEFPKHNAIHSFPRPMIHTDNLDFSFSGLKTALLYKLKDLGFDRSKNSETLDKQLPTFLLREIAREYEDAIIEVLISKTKKALLNTTVSTLICAGGVSANSLLRKSLSELSEITSTPLLLPPLRLTGDNATMIGMAAHLQSPHQAINTLEGLNLIRAEGTFSISQM